MSDLINEIGEIRYLSLKRAAALVEPYRTESALKVALQQKRIASIYGNAEKGRKQWFVDTESPLFMQWRRKARIASIYGNAEKGRKQWFVDTESPLFMQWRRKADEMRQQEQDVDELEQLRQRVAELESENYDLSIDVRARTQTLEREWDRSSEDARTIRRLAADYRDLQHQYQLLAEALLNEARTRQLGRPARPATSVPHVRMNRKRA